LDENIVKGCEVVRVVVGVLSEV